ncbi:DUF6285 domain-containing protein [Thermomonas sp.]|uniref:DUF6285 domain-containing protein n=1 Tax=Thermomonas sp. TaxID=1971895 RepID=UPI00248A0CFA|nr:DUF6285 domain-containing protein [Thermomonas sp.]MDI1251603.1 DUF6285 domain-containing protein [Thermomonas sp.]
MNKKSDAVDLLKTSLEALRQQVLPALSGNTRTVGLMVANAMGIAIRVLQQGDAQEAEEMRGLQALVRGELDDPSSLRRELIQQIRTGAFDAETHPEGASRLKSFLSQSVVAQCSIDQPKALAALEEAQP